MIENKRDNSLFSRRNNEITSVIEIASSSCRQTSRSDLQASNRELNLDRKRELYECLRYLATSHYLHRLTWLSRRAWQIFHVEDPV